MTKIKCLICNRAFKKPLSHVWQKHGIFSHEYKKAYGLDTTKGVISPEAREILREHVQRNYAKVVSENLIVKGQARRYQHGDKTIGTYTRTPQQIERLKANFERYRVKTGRKPTPKIIIYCALCWKPKEIHPKQYRENNNFCGVVCRNRAINARKYNH